MAFTLMLDTSGSTHSTKYYSNVKRVIEPFISKIKNVYFWNSTCEQKHVEILQKDVNELKEFANGGTKPMSCIEIMKQKKIFENIIFITDGEIDADEVKKMDEFILENEILIKNIECFVIQDNHVNDSVLIPLLRSNENCKLTRINQLGDNLVMNIKTNLLNQLENMPLEEFLEKKEDIKQCIINTKIGSLNKFDISKFILLRDKYKSEIRKNINLNRDKEIETKFLNNHIEYFEKFQDSILIENFQDLDIIEKEFSRIINLCNLDLNDKLSYCENFNLLASNDADTTEEITQTQVDLNLKFECPICYDEDTVVLTFNSEILFEKTYLTNPLHLINNKEFVNQFRRSVMRPIGLKTFTKLYDKSDPFSRQEIIGFLILSNNKEHVRISENMICKIFLQGKYYKNLQLFFFVVWYLLPQIEYLNEIKPVFDKFIQDYSFKTWPGLINSNNYKEKVDIKTAFLFIVTSFKNIKYNKGNLTNEKKIGCFQQYFSCIKLIKSYLKQCAIDIDLNEIEHACESLSLFYKKSDNKLLALIRTAYQNSIQVDDQNIFIDGPGNEESAIKIIKEKFSASLLNINEILNIVGFEKFEYAINWPNYSLNPDIKYKKLKICPNTCRPFYFTKLYPVKLWKNDAVEHYGDKFISTTKHLLEYIVKYETIPTENEFLIFLAKQYSAYGNSHFTLPSCIKRCIQYAISDYDHIFQNVDVNEIKRRYLDSTRIRDRVMMQQFFPNDYENYLPQDDYHKNKYVHYQPIFKQD